MQFHVLFLVVTVFITCSYTAEVNVANTQVWGPGLRSAAMLPVHYFHIQAYDKKNKIIKSDLGDDAFVVTLSNQDGRRIRAWRQMLNLHNGTYIARFRLYDYSGDLTIAVTYKGKHVANSPYALKDTYGDECYCPINLKQWMTALECPASFKQIDNDIRIHQTIDLSTLRKRMLDRFGKHHSICHYVVKNNEVYRECHGSITGFKMFMDAPLLNLARKVKLPDIEFFINLGDWPLEKTHGDPLPIISWCGSDSSYDIVLPTYDLTNAVLEMLGRVSLDPFSVQANTGPKWKNKLERGFFRGRDSRQERLDLAAMSVQSPDVIEAAITNYFFFKKDEEKYGKSVKHVSFYDFFKYKYQLNIDGTVAAYRFPYLMLGDSLVLKQNSAYYEHFYKRMKPYEHYLPLEGNLSDVKEKIMWARKNDQQAKKIQEAGTKLAREIITPAEILCYHVMLFKEYAKRQNQPVTVLDSMEKLEHPKQDNCRCRRLKKKAKKPKEEL